MLLKVLVYAYLSNVYSSRKIEAGLQENIHFMWLSGMQQPDHNAINRYRTERLKDVLKTIFSQVVQLLSKSGHLSLKEVYTDGTKIEANANRYTFVWGNSVKHNRHKMEEQLRDNCHKTNFNRKVEINHQLKDYKARANELLKSETGIYHRKKRAYEVEPVFANIKHNKNFKRFNLRGIKKLEIETGLIALAHNLKKAA